MRHTARWRYRKIELPKKPLRFLPLCPSPVSELPFCPTPWYSIYCHNSPTDPRPKMTYAYYRMLLCVHRHILSPIDWRSKSSVAVQIIRTSVNRWRSSCWLPTVKCCIVSTRSPQYAPLLVYRLTRHPWRPGYRTCYMESGPFRGSKAPRLHTRARLHQAGRQL